MTTSIPFDLNAAFCDWREQLQQSPHFRIENLDELETHLRDSVNVLQSKGLTADEAFMIGTRRVGTAAALEDQFAAENGGRGWWHSFRRLAHNYKNRLLHLVILAYFTLGCWLLWGCLKLSQSVEAFVARANHLAQVDFTGAPAFTRLFWSLMPYWYVPPVTAAIYCGFVWARKRKNQSSWIAFFSLTTASLFVLLIPVLIAGQLPILQFLGTIPAKTFEAAH